MYCTNCGNEYKIIVKFCPNCGKKVNINSHSTTFVKKTQREIEDFGNVVKNSKVYKNVSDSSESIQYAKKTALKSIDIFLVILAIFSMIAILGQFIPAFNGRQLGIREYYDHWTTDIPSLIAYFIGAYFLPLFLIFLGFRKIKFGGRPLGEVISIILFIITLMLFFK